MNDDFKIYTKTGDKGKTSLIGGTRVPKYHIRIEAFGTVDELNSYIGLIRDQQIDKHSKNVLIEIQKNLFTIETSLAVDPQNKNIKKLPYLEENDVQILEKEIDKMNESLPRLNSFIIPGGNTIVSYCHIARCVCRRTERIITKLGEKNYVEKLHIKYLNRLSDYLFVLSRKIAKDFNIKEIPWKAKM